MAAPRPLPPSLLVADQAQRLLHPVLLGSSQVAIKVVQGGCRAEGDTAPHHHQPYPVANSLFQAEIRNFSYPSLTPRRPGALDSRTQACQA